MFEGIKITTKLECVRGFGCKRLGQYKTKHTDRYWSFEMDILIFENYFLIENYTVQQHQRLRSDN